MPAASVTVFGGTGFLGRAIVRRLAENGVRVSVVARYPERLQLDGQNERIRAVRADIRDPAAVAKAVEGAEAVVNAVGLYVERGAETFNAVHVEGARQVARQASDAGAGQLVHISGIGASVASPSSYVRARAEGERCAREAFEGATVVRPSVLFGPGDALLSAIDTITRVVPVFPLFGTGDTRLQPIYVGDVADAVAEILEDPKKGGNIFELGGPRIYTYRELVEAVLDYRGRRRLLLPVPFAMWTLQARLLALSPSPPLTEDQVILMREDNVVGQEVMTIEALGTTVHDVEAMLPVCLGPERGAAPR
jgi:NADH dehydrogenase